MLFSGMCSQLNYLHVLDRRLQTNVDIQEKCYLRKEEKYNITDEFCKILLNFNVYLSWSSTAHKI